MLNYSANGPSGYNLTNSLRFRSSASAYLSRTPASAGNRQIFTFSYWLKRGSISVDQQFYGIPSTVSTQGAHYRFNASDNLRINDYTNGVSDQIYLVTTQVFRDPSAWYHIVVAVDTTQATASNRVKLYVNGSQITAFSTATYPSQNQNLAVNQAKATYIGYGDAGSGGYFDGYLADINFIDGSAKTPSDFGETDTTTGVWKPKAYTGTYGTNGFYLKFSDIATTSGSNAGLGKDFSGNSNYWTTNNISVTAGTTYDAMKDVPTNTSATVANYCVLNPLDKQANAAVANANLQASTATGDAQWKSVRTSMYTNTGKIYFEATLTTVGSTNWVLGLADESFAVGTSNVYVGSSVSSWGIIGISTAIYGYNNGASTTFATGITQAVNDVFMVAVDYDAGKIWFGRNGTWYTSGNPSSGTNQAYTFTANTRLAPAVSVYNGGASTSVVSFNAGQRPLSYTPPSGFVALNTYNLPTPTILQGNKYMDATLWSGNSSAQTVVNQAQFKPDFVWVKSRTNTQWNNLTDSVRGVTKLLYSNATNAEATNSTALTSFNSNGFSVGDDSGGNGVNTSGQNYVGWQWQAGQGSTSSNTSGSITSTVSVNTTAGFSIVTYTGTGANATVGHGLGVAPRMIICKNRASATDWAVYHASVGNTGALRLNLTAVTETDSRYWNNTTPTSTVFSIGSSSTVNGSSNLQVAYCWAEIAGFSRFGSYTGNGSTDGTFVYTGFRPKFIMIKEATGANAASASWQILDTSRSLNNVSNLMLYPNLSGAEGVGDNVDILSNGFKLRASGYFINESGGTYIYAAFAENPFKNALAR